MNRILRRANLKMSLSNAAFLLAGSSVIGIVLGILRTKLINANFNNFSTGAYFAAFKVPDLIFYTLASGALSVAFLPVLSDKLQNSSKKDAWVLTSYVINAIALVMFITSLVMIIFPRPILEYIVAPGFSDERLDVAASIMRLVAINPLVFAVGSVLATVQQAVGRFFFFAVAPLLYNLSIIVSIYLFRDSLGVVGVGLGVAIGSILHILIISLGMHGLGFRHLLKINFKNGSFREVMKALPPRSLDQGIGYVNGIVQTRFASKISVNAVTNFENALILHNAPVRLIGTAIGMAAFPRFTQRISQGRPDLFRKEFLEVMRAMIWISLPVVAVTYFARDLLARIIFARDNREIALILGFLSLSVFFRTIYSIISRYYYALRDTVTPLLVTLMVIVGNILLAYYLAKPTAYGVAGLAIAASIVAVMEVVVLLLIMIKRDPKLFGLDFIKSLVNILSAGAFTILAALLVASWLPLRLSDQGFVITIKLTIITIATATVHLVVSWLFGVDEARPVIKRLKKWILKPIKL